MRSLRIIVDDVHESATLSVTSAALPVSNTANTERSKVWRSVDLATQVITGTLATPTILSGLAVCRHNLTGGGRIGLRLKLHGEVEFESVDFFGGFSAVGGFIPAGIWAAGIDGYGATYNQSLGVLNTTLWFPETLCDEYEITIEDPDNEDGYMQVCQIILGWAITTRYNFSLGAEIEWAEDTTHSRSEAGSLRPEGTGERWRVLAFNLDYLQDDDRVTLVTTLQRAGMDQAVFISLYPEEGGMLEVEYAMVAMRTTSMKFIHWAQQFWKNALIFAEV